MAREAHPRWRGEHLPRAWVSALSYGSSPLARGARVQTGHRAVCPGLIPAGAGSTRWPFPRAASQPAHPRWRGEHLLIGTAASTIYGSSPLARGAPADFSQTSNNLGLIPAGAGSTYPVRPAGQRTQAHPRWRGEH